MLWQLWSLLHSGGSVPEIAGLSVRDLNREAEHHHHRQRRQHDPSGSLAGRAIRGLLARQERCDRGIINDSKTEQLTFRAELCLWRSMPQGASR